MRVCMDEPMEEDHLTEGLADEARELGRGHPQPLKTMQVGHLHPPQHTRKSRWRTGVAGTERQGHAVAVGC